jgi:hypothetical protein
VDPVITGPEQKRGALYPFVNLKEHPLVSVVLVASAFAITLLFVVLLYYVNQTFRTIEIWEGMLSFQFLPAFGPFPLIESVVGIPSYYVSHNVLFNHIFTASIIIVVIASVVYSAFRFAKDVISSNEENNTKALENNGLFWVCLLFCTIMAANLLYGATDMALGMPGYDSLFQRFDIVTILGAVGPVWKELVIYVFYIGIPTTIASLVITKKIGSLRRLLGGFGPSKFALILIVLASLISGAFVGGTLWGVFPLMYLGLALGYLYIRFGLHAAITLHILLSIFYAYDLREWGLYETIYYIPAIFGIFTTIYILSKLRENKNVLRALPWFSDVKRQ